MTTQAYKVLEAEHKKDVPPKPGSTYGPSQVIGLKLADPVTDVPFLCEWFTKKTTAIPQPGESLIGDVVDDGRFGLKFKKAAGGWGGGSGGPRPEDPKKAAHIAFMNAQGNATSLLLAKATAGLAEPEDFSPSKIDQLVDYFVERARTAREAA